MRILLTGASGSLGQRIALALAAQGHELRACAREPATLAALYAPWPNLRVVRADLAQLCAEAQWLPLLDGVELVINAAGVFHERHPGEFERIHHLAPAALFRAAQRAGVGRVIQLSALGAEADAPSPFLRSKHAADAVLRTLALEWWVVQPSLVFTAEGASSRLFLGLAALPWLALPAGGAALVQPIHVDDLVLAVVRLCNQATPARRTLALVGPAPLTLADYIATLRARLGWGHARCLALPYPLALKLAHLAEWLPGSLLSRDSLRMLAQGNQADSAPLSVLLGQPPRPAAQFITPDARPHLRREARLWWARPFATLTIALLWLTTALLSVWPSNQAVGYQLLADSGITPLWQTPLLYAAALLDAGLGIATLWRPGVRLWQLQLGVISGYSAFIAWRLPELLAHPFAPVLKNLPIIALILLLLALREER